MRAPKYILIAWMIFIVGVASAKHGQPRTGKHSFGAVAGAMVVECLLLWWGGFFT